MRMLSAGDIIKKLDLKPHPEGGHFREMYRAPDEPRGASTAIYFLLKAGERSHWHRVDADEIWHHYAGAPLELRIHARADPGRARRGLRVDSGDSSAVLSLTGGNGQATLALPTHRRGWLDVERLRISTTRPLGLARAWAYVWPDAPLLVYPAPEANGPPLPEGSGANALARLRPSGDDVHHLRSYRRGDARRAIAWKPSARRDTLLVREYEQPMGADVVLDWRQLSGIDYEARIRRLARWIDEAEREGRRYRLDLPGREGRAGPTLPGRIH